MGQPGMGSLRTIRTRSAPARGRLPTALGDLTGTSEILFLVGLEQGGKRVLNAIMRQKCRNILIPEPPQTSSVINQDNRRVLRTFGLRTPSNDNETKVVVETVL